MRRYLLIFALIFAGTGSTKAAEAGGGAQSAQPAQQEEQNLGNPLNEQPSAMQGPDQATHPEEPEHAVDLSFLYTAELWDNVSGGIKQGQSTINNFDASIAVDGEKTFGLDGAKFLLDMFYARSGDLRNLTGSAQQTSAYETDTGNLFRVYQAWYSQSFNEDRTSLLVGLYDVNTEFDNFEASELFFNSGYGVEATFDQSGLNGPSIYPDTSPAIRLRQALGEGFSIQAAVLDGVADDPNHPTSTDLRVGGSEGALVLGELDYLPSDKTKIVAGYWRYTSPFDELGTPSEKRGGNQGGYAGIGQSLFEEKDHAKLDGFLRFGIAEAAFNEFGRSLSGGLVYSGLVPGREKDQLGIAMNVAENGQPYKDEERAAGLRVDDYETNAELTYRAPINDWLTVQPNVQYTINPGTNPLLKNDLIIGLRLEFGYHAGFDSLEAKNETASEHP